MFLRFGCLFVFVSMYYVDLPSFPVLAKWPYVVGALCGPLAQFPQSPAPGIPGVSLVWVVCALLLQLSLDIVEWSMGGIDSKTDWL